MNHIPSGNTENKKYPLSELIPGPCRSFSRRLVRSNNGAMASFCLRDINRITAAPTKILSTDCSLARKYKSSDFPFPSTWNGNEWQTAFRPFLVDFGNVDTFCQMVIY